MRSWSSLAWSRGLGLVVAFAAACGASANGDDVELDGHGGAVAELTGTVWAPGMAPGMVPTGEEIPIAGAKIYLRAERPAPIPTGVYCETCMDVTGAAVSDARGRFTVGTLTPGPQ